MQILYYTGTGNSLQAAKRIGTLLETPIERLDKKFMASNRSLMSKKIMLVFPLYYAGAPKVVLDYISKINLDSVTDIHVVVTRGASSGIVDKQFKKIVGDKLKSLHYVSMPGNYILQYASENEDIMKSKLDESEKEFINIAKKIKSGEHTIDNQGGLMRVVGKPVYGYFGMKLKKTDKNFLVIKSCNGCEICSKVCHVGNIEMQNNKPTWNGNCQECMACIQLCPQSSIDYGKGVLSRKRYKHPDISLNDLMK